MKRKTCEKAIYGMFETERRAEALAKGLSKPTEMPKEYGIRWVRKMLKSYVKFYKSYDCALIALIRDRWPSDSDMHKYLDKVVERYQSGEAGGKFAASRKYIKKENKND